MLIRPGRSRPAVLDRPGTYLRVLTLDQGQGALSGAQRVLLRLAPLLEERGIELVLAGPANTVLAQTWRSAGREHVALDLPRTGPRGVAAISRAARRSRADVLLANSDRSHLDTAVAGRFARVPAVLLLHEQSRRGLRARLRGRALRLARRTVAVSDAVAGTLAPADRVRVTTVPNGVDVAGLRPGPAEPYLRSTLGGRDGEVLVVALTRLDPVKRLEEGVDAVAAARQQGARVHLAVVGSSSTGPEYAARVTAYAVERLGEHVTFAGERSDVPEVLRAADVVLDCGTVDGLPLGLVEAQACGRPVVAYAVPGVEQAVLDGESGLLAPAGDVSALAHALTRLAGDAPLRARMGEAGRSHVLARYTLRSQAEQVARILRDAVG